MDTRVSFYITGGTLRHDAPSYVERGADRGLFDGLLRGEFCYVLTSRQMGKSSLMVRTASKLRDQGIVVVVLDLTAVGQNVTPEQWYHGLLMRVGRQLWAEDELERFWDAHPKLSPVQRFFSALRDGILGRKHGASRILKPDGRVVIFVDEIDVVRSLPFRTDEFFAAIRECYNRRTEDREFERVTFCLLGVATPSDLITDTRITPFNIGRRIELHDFTPAEAAALAAWLDPRLALPQSRVLLERVLHWTNGHPYLTQRLCQAVAEHSTTANEATRGSTSRVDTICAQLFFTADARENDDNLIFVRERLLRSDEVDRGGLLALYGQMVARKTVQADRTNPLISILYLSGVARPNAGRLVPRNRIYERVFDRHWIDANLPEADVRRQREAFRRGVIRTTAIAALVVAAMTVMVFIAINQARKARTALAGANFSQAKARRVSDVSGRRHESLPALRDARRDYPDLPALRDEVIACLGLVDLKERTNGNFSAAGIWALNIEPGVSASAEPSGAIMVHSTKDGSVIKRHSGFRAPVERLWLSRTKPYLIAELKKPPRNRLMVWNWLDDLPLFALEHGVNGRAFDISHEENLLAVGDPQGSIFVYELPAGRLLSHFQPVLSSQSPRMAASIRFNPSANLLAVSSADDQFIEIWDIQARKRLRQLYHSGPVNDIAWHPQGQWLASACTDDAVHIWDINDSEKLPLKKLTGHENDVTSVAFNDRGNLLASLGKDDTLRLWILASEAHIVHRLGDGATGELRFRSDGRLLAVNGTRASRVWDVLGGEYSVLQRPGVTFHDFSGIDFSPDGQLLAAWNSDTVTVWDLKTRRELAALPFTNISSVCFSADADHLLASTDSGLLQCPLQRHTVAGALRIAPGPASHLRYVTNELGYLAVTPDRAKAAVVQQTNVMVYALGSPMTVNRIDAGQRFAKLAIHPNGRCIAAATTRDNVVQIFGCDSSLARPVRLCVPRGEYFSFSRDGQWFGVCANGEFEFYRVGTWEKTAFTVPRSSGSEQHGPLAFSPDNKTFAIAHSRYHVRLYQIVSGQAKLLATLESPDRKPLLALAFSADGRQLAALAKDQGIQLWNLALVREGLAELNLQGDWPGYSTHP
jgi:WD40 repeat protein